MNDPIGFMMIVGFPCIIMVIGMAKIIQDDLR